MFYNEEVKTQFINDYMRSRVVAETSLSGLFNKTAAIEEEKDKDCSEFTQDEILDMYRRFNAKSVHVLENYNVHLKSYVGFCMYKGLCTENNYSSACNPIYFVKKIIKIKRRYVSYIFIKIS